MQTWQNKDKSDWPDGPWMDEPDKAQWIHEGLDCLIVRGTSGALCGYVGIPESHELFGKDYSEADVDCHGGLTFASLCSPSEKGDAHGICHVEDGAANKTVWWLGFDCAHSWDVCPSFEHSFDSHSTYREFNYVKSEVEKMASQLT